MSSYQKHVMNLRSQEPMVGRTLRSCDVEIRFKLNLTFPVIYILEKNN